jgi:hypothetical protein
VASKSEFTTASEIVRNFTTHDLVADDLGRIDSLFGGGPLWHHHPAVDLGAHAEAYALMIYVLIFGNTPGAPEQFGL